MADIKKAGKRFAEAFAKAGKEAEAALAAEKAAKAEKVAKPGVDYADPLKPATMRFSEALGNAGAEGKTLNFTEADRSRVFGKNRGGVGFSGLQLYSKPHQQANTVWGFGNRATAEKKIRQNDPENSLFTTFVGSPQQHKSNSVVIGDAIKEFQKSVKKGAVPREQIMLMNQRLNELRDQKTGEKVFEGGFDLTDPRALDVANTFSRRAAVGDVMLGLGVKGPMSRLDFKKQYPNTKFVDGSKIESLLKRETDPDLMDANTYDVGNRLFTMDGKIIERPDLNEAFPIQVTGNDLGFKYGLVPPEKAMRDFYKAREGRKDKNQKPSPVSYYDLSRAEPSQFIDEDYLTFLQKEGYKKGGQAKMAEGGKVDAYQQRLDAMIAKEMGMAEGGEAFKRLPMKAAGGGIAKLGKAIQKASKEADAAMPAVNRIDMNYKDVTKRVPELTEAAQKVAKGEMSPAEYDALVNQYKPVMPYGFVPAPATADDAMRALTENKRAMFGKTSEMTAGEQADLRLDIPAYKDHGVWVNSIHRKDAPTVYGSVSSVKNATMIGEPDKALKVAQGGPKAPFAVIRGEWNPMDEATAVKNAQKYLKHKDWRQVGYDPERHGYFYDRTTMEPILGAEEIIQIGPLVLAKKPRFGAKKEQKFEEGGAAFKTVPWRAAGGGWAKAAKAIQKAATEAGMKAPQTAEKELTTLQDTHTMLGDRVAARVKEAEDMMKGFEYKYDKGQRVFTKDSAAKNKPPYTILGRTRVGNIPMTEDGTIMGKKIIDPATGKAKRTPYEPGYKVRYESGDEWSEFNIPASAILGDVEKRKGGVVHMAEGGDPEALLVPPTETERSKASLMAEILARMAKEQGKEEVASLKKPRALTDLLNRGVIAPLVGAPVDLINMGLEGVDAIRDLASGKRVENRLASEKPVGGSEQLKDLMNRFNVTSGEDRPMMETGLSLASPAGAVKGAAKVTQKTTGALNKIANTGLNKSGKLTPSLTEAKTAQAGTPQGAKYATQQEGPFLRVRPTALDPSKAKGSGTREASGLSSQGADGAGSGEVRGGLPQRYSTQEVDRIIADPALNEPLQIAQRYTQENLGTDFKAPDISESSLAKQSAIARTHELALTDDPAYKSAVFDAYARTMPDVLEQAGAKNYDDLMEKAYRQLAKETDAQFQAMPFNFSYHRGGEGNYSGTRELLEDLHGNKHMYVYQGGDPHDYLNRVDEFTGLNENEKFRAVHDAMGHGIYGNEFGPLGEEKAWAIHQQMYSPLARLAMTAETRGQNSLVNYSPLNVGLKEDVAKLRELQIEARRRGDKEGERVATEAIREAFGGFQFAPQKSILLPPEFVDPKYAGGMPDYIQPLVTPAKGTTTQSALTHFSHRPDLTMTDPSRYGTGIKGAEKQRLDNTQNPFVPRTYFYAGEPGLVAPEPGLGVNRYRSESESLYDITADPLRFKSLAREANRTPFTAKYNAGIRAPDQELTDMERMIREYGYEGYINPKASKPAAVVYEPKQVERRRQGGLTLAKQ